MIRALISLIVRTEQLYSILNSCLDNLKSYVKEIPYDGQMVVTTHVLHPTQLNT